MGFDGFESLEFFQLFFNFCSTFFSTFSQEIFPRTTAYIASQSLLTHLNLHLYISTLPILLLSTTLFLSLVRSPLLLSPSIMAAVEQDAASKPSSSESTESSTESLLSSSSSSSSSTGTSTSPPPGPTTVTTVTTLDTKESDEWKSQGNDEYKKNHFPQAIELYTKAIECNPSIPSYYSNRALCHIKMENFGLALSDAATAIKVDSRYAKAYYRKGQALYYLAKYKQAESAFRAVAKRKPNDRDARAKLQECKKARIQQQFAIAIQSEHTKPASQTVDVKSMSVPDSYDGPTLGDEMSLEFIQGMIQHFKDGKNLPRKYVYQVLLQIIKLLSDLPTLIEIDIPQDKHITVCGDVHGQLYDVFRIFEMNGMPSDDNPYLFNGDFVDRGSWSFEIMMMFFCFKLMYPTNFHLLRGNHESRSMNQIYGFQGEVVAKCDEKSFELFTECFNWLPLCAVLGGKVMVVHGGLFGEDGVKLDDIRKIDRNRQPPDSGLMCDLLWSDPQDDDGRAPSKRGVGLSFGPDVTKRFLDSNGLDLIVRSHEVKSEGYDRQSGGRLITIFSAPNYCDQMGNKGAFIHFGTDLEPKFTQFEAAPHPPMKPMAYARPMFR
jgi:serine/threonine-protein phosphatase 5